MNPSSWQDLPDQPPGQSQTSFDAPTMVLERRAADDPPPALSPRSDSLWWRVGSAVVLVAVLGAIAWLISDRTGGATESQAADPTPTVPTTLPDDSGGAGSPEPGQGPEAGAVDPFERREGFPFSFGTDELPPEVREFLERNGPRFTFPEDFQPGDRPNFEEFFGGEGRRFGDGFGFNFEGALPPEFVELLERLPELLFGSDEAERAEVEALVTELLQDPGLAPELREFVERLANRLGITVES